MIKLNLSNTIMQCKAGMFLGDALIDNPEYKIEKIWFRNVRLEENGVYRMLEAANANPNIKRLHLGVVSDYGLRSMAELLVKNKTLIRLDFQEDEKAPWTSPAKAGFCAMLKEYTELEQVRVCSFREDSEEH